MIGTKGQYAQHRGVTPGRVSQWLSAGWLDEALIDAAGSRAQRSDRSARVDFERADAALRQYLNVGQVLGQGRMLPEPTAAVPAPPAGEPRTAFAAPPAAPSSPLTMPATDPASRLQEAKAQQAELETARQLRKAREEQGLYILTANARAEFGRRMVDLVAAVEAWLPDLVAATSAHLVEGGSSDRKELLVLARHKWREFRAQRARLAAAAADPLDPFVAEPEVPQQP